MASQRVVVRPADTTDVQALHRVNEIAFHESQDPAERELTERLLEVERLLGAFDGTQAVGVAGTFSLTMTIPGAVVPVAGVTAVSVLPTHRRRGILRDLMRTQLTSYHEEQREAVAALFASEPGIYGRFGYGAASRSVNVAIPRTHGAFVRSLRAEDLQLVLAEPSDATKDLRVIYEAQLRARTGQLARDDRRWDEVLLDPKGNRGGATPLRAIVARDASGPRAYALYSVNPVWTPAGPDGRVQVRELIATDPTAYAAVWRYLLDIDLVSVVEARRRPIDDPILHLLAELRRAEATIRDGLWVRLVDVDRALASRTFATDIEVILDIEDDFCPWNTGRWRLAGDSTGAVCERTTSRPDLRLTSTELGAAYLGGTRLSALGSAGWVEELRAGATQALSVAMAADVQPWCAQIF
jgi:predicted acetyltransferase